MSWGEIAWNGVRFSTPELWEVAKIGPRYLLLAYQGEPALEIKWEKIKGRFSHQTALKRMNSLHKNAVQESPLPEEWVKVLGDFDVMGFTWQAAARGGRGAILYCPACGNAILIQFFGNLSGSSYKTCRRVLASFQDHSDDNRVRWSLFDIRAEIPAEYRLLRYRFEAGRFEMHFGSKRQRITLYRWGPASALLGSGDLFAFAAKTIRIHRNEWHPLTCTGHHAVQWEKAVLGGLWARCWERMIGKPHFQWFRLWHLVGKNRLLGVGANGDKTFPSELLDSICTQYETL
ncbi:hypothetical protein D4S03_03965 [bacterium]|nr:MAG: hypothetical protein D4S03_03965 [bacterium]